MLTRSKFWMVAWAFISFMSFFAPHHAYAQLSSSMDCSAGNSFDETVQNNRSAYQQELFNAAQKKGALFPVQSALNQCFTNIMNAFQKLPGLGNPLQGLVAAVLTQLLVSVITSTCSQVMSLIQQAQQDLINLTKICLPLPSFGSLQLPNISLGSCSGGISFSPLSSFQPVNRPTYAPSSFQGSPR